MISFDSLTLKAFYEENKDYFLGSKVSKIQQPSRKDLIFWFRKDGKTKKMYVNIDPNFHHICFISNEENEKRRNLSIPKMALMFCMLLRKYLYGAKVINVVVPDYERIFEIKFRTFDVNIGEHIDLSLNIELMGKYSNVILLNDKTRSILGCAHNVSEQKSSVRELKGAILYSYPQISQKKDILKTNFQNFCKILENSKDESIALTIVNNFYYFSNFLTKYSLHNYNSKNLSQIEMKNCYDKLRSIVNLENLKPNFVEITKEIFLFDERENEHRSKVYFSTVNEMIDYYYSLKQFEYLFENKKRKILNTLNKKLKKIKINIENFEKQISQMDIGISYKKKADLLMIHQYEIVKSKRSIVVKDFETDKFVKIALDINLSIVENANKFYKLYSKYKGASEFAKVRIQRLEGEKSIVQNQVYYASIAKTLDDLDTILDEDMVFERVQKKKDDRRMNIQSTQIGNYKVYIGKNDKQNDYLLSKLSSPFDVWFHIKDMASAHVVLKNENRESNIEEGTILKVAKLLKEISLDSNATKVSVIYTFRKYVKKGNSKGLGFVTYKKEKEIVID